MAENLSAVDVLARTTPYRPGTLMSSHVETKPDHLDAWDAGTRATGIEQATITNQRRELYCQAWAPSRKAHIYRFLVNGPVDVRIYSFEEAQALVPKLQEWMNRAQDALAELKLNLEQLGDIEGMWTQEQLSDPDCRDHADWQRLRYEMPHLENGVNEALSEFVQRGIEVKSIESGLVDFYYEFNGALVYLCWITGETELKWYHTLQGGFARRLPIDELI